MNQEILALSVSAATIGFVHTVLGPDHYLPFVAMSQARGWSRLRTILLTIVCGFGHVGSSVVLGLIGVALGVALGRLEAIEAVRGDIAAWVLIAFGLVYTVWGIRRALKKKIHTHTHPHAHDQKANITPWILFTIFVLGPCEPLIPMLMYPAARENTLGMIVVAVIFSVVTITTMTVMVLVLSSGVQFIPLKKLERYSHALAGFVILSCGVAIRLGL